MKILPISITLAMASGSLTGQDAPQDRPRPVSFLFGLGLTVGGDNLATATYTDGSSTSIKAGGIFFFKAGFDWQLQSRLSLQGTFGIHGNSANAKNGSLKFERNFLEGVLHWRTTPKQRIGLGLRKVSGAKLTSSGAVANLGDLNSIAR